MNELESLKQKVKIMELEAKLKKLGGVTVPKIKKSSESKEKNEPSDPIKRLKHEIQELETAKMEHAKALKNRAAEEQYTKKKGFFQKLATGAREVAFQANINKQINERRGMISKRNAIESLRLQNTLEEEKEKLQKRRKKNNVSFDDILGGSGNSGHKGISAKDIFG